MAMAFLPVAFAAGGGFLLLHHGVIAPVDDVADRQRRQITPLQRLNILIWDAVIPVDEHLEDPNTAHLNGYRNFREEIETEFARVMGAVGDIPSVQALIERARQSWTDADDIAGRLLSIGSPDHSSETAAAFSRFHGSIMTTSDRLQAAYRQLGEKIDQDHDMAILWYERSIWLSTIAAGIALLAILGGVLMIGRVLKRSVDRLVEGAARFAEGDRSHRIEVAVPPELNRVAEEFNYMIGRIDESERALSDLAHVDSLTGISNRRAFDTAFTEALSRHIRTGVPASLLALDLDHFKHVNDTWGHAAGDEVLRAITKVMIDNARPTDRVFRMGGEEFCVLVSETSAEEAMHLAERLRSAIEKTTVRFDAEQIRVTVSIGIAELTRSADREGMLIAADQALYKAKSEGRNRIVVYDDTIEMDENAA
ncbi:diguanylate cyclase [Notoacmeibacter sp. MSK16QG-6]|uniref:diguanylate cyclase n=1 Tax=Notoacmeibacter sp. MSK16QG-6 TaxID=2957982 RepID=UPI00209E83A5|nr:diguanylate cyclase [Notoacmeibacter sp. MSK16QG-6]MCP1197840.1 diguanylate cyclase [Notoacmeibacter sp. MSK16QG-6]